MCTMAMSTNKKNLVVLGCSATKVETDGVLPAIHLYDGPTFRVLRSFLRENRWPEALSLAVLSAKFGLIGGLAQIPYYNQRMTRARASELGPSVTASLQELGAEHRTVDLVLGQDYRETIDLRTAEMTGSSFRFAEGAIGMKLNRLHHLLRDLPHQRRRRRKQPAIVRSSRPLYFLPDWDDFLDVGYNFDTDSFSATSRADRNEEHSIALMRPQRVCDGVLVSLAQNLGTKGLLKRIGHMDPDSFAPKSVRAHFKLTDDQWAFGDCGAFSYVNEDSPTISVEQAVSLYDLYEFDYGASVDHIPVPEIENNGAKIPLSESDRKSRIRLTRRNAERFISSHREHGALFVPVGVIQGLDPQDFARQVGDYYDMGYTHVALGGLVPRSDSEIRQIVERVHRSNWNLSRPLRVHLLGVYRPALQSDFRRCQIASFDSATYFRKAWLRSDQNYLAANGEWYAAIRIPPTRDARTLARLKKSRLPEAKIKRLEASALSALHAFDRGTMTLKRCLAAITEYDRLLIRAEVIDPRLEGSYRRTLSDKPWRLCDCAVCKTIGIDVVTFRGLNRNKRRGAHNTLMLYNALQKPAAATPQNR
jgi:hypothetical protein